MKNLTTQLRLASLLSLILLAGTAYAQLTPLGDSYTNTAASTTNYGAKTVLDVESSQTTFIQFNLSSIPSTYTSADIAQATLKLYVNAVTTAGSFNVDYVNGAWTESTIDASNAPALGTTIVASIPLVTADKNQYILINVTAAVQAWLSGTANDGIALVGNSPLNASFDSKESTTTSHAAELDIVFAGGGTLTGITTASGSGLIGGGTSGTLNLSLTNACTASQILQWNGSAWGCASPGTGTITGVTAGTDLTGGGTSGNVTLNLNTAATNALYAQLNAANTFTANQTLNGGTLTATSAGATISATTTSTTAAAVVGTNNAASGTPAGVYGSSVSPAGYGVQGVAISAVGYGVFGSNTSTIGPAPGVYGTTMSNTGYGVQGSSPFYVGVQGTGRYGVSGEGGAEGDFGTLGFSPPASNEGQNINITSGVWGDSSPNVGVLGSSDSNHAGAFYNDSSVATLFAENATGSSGGVAFSALVSYVGSDSYAILGDPGCGSGYGRIALQLSQAGMSNCNNYTLTGASNGETYLNAMSGQTVHLRVNNTDSLVASGSGVNVVGTLTAGDKEFKIDHPLDPANKYLYHTSVESSEMMNIYAGNITTDGSGLATVTMPDWFEALNTDFRYQLTVIGQFAQAIVASEISQNQFSIHTDKPNVKVSWQVTGVRHDAFANANRSPVEVEKAPADRGHYLYPEVFGQPASARIGNDVIAPASEPFAHNRETHSSPVGRRLQLSPPAPTNHIPSIPAMQKPNLPGPSVPMPVLPKAVPLPHPAAQAGKPEVNQK